MKQQLTHGSLFSGIGGFDLGFERAGIKTIWQVENNPYCLKVLEKHWPNVKRYTDIKEVKKLEYVDIISGGFPCQPFSVAGKQRGAADDRYLWPEMRRVIAEVGPHWVVAENVPGLIKMALDQALSDMEALGYTTGAVTIPACAVDAPHRRERLWIMGYAEHNGQSQPEVTGSPNARSNNREATTKQAGKSKRPGEQYAAVADPKNLRRRQNSSTPHGRTPEQSRGGTCGTADRVNWWTIEPDVGRVAHGIPNRVDRLTALGNAIVPQIAEEIGRMIIASNKTRGL